MHKVWTPVQRWLSNPKQRNQNLLVKLSKMGEGTKVVKCCGNLVLGYIIGPNRIEND